MGISLDPSYEPDISAACEAQTISNQPDTLPADCEIISELGEKASILGETGSRSALDLPEITLTRA